MSDATQKTLIEIQSIERKTITKKDNTQGNVTTIVDGRTQRQMNTWDSDWTANWKIGDMIEVVVGTPKSWTDRRNVTHETWPVSNPNAAPRKPYAPRPAAAVSADPAQTSLVAAAILLAPHFVGKKIDAALVVELANTLSKTMVSSSPAANVAAKPTEAPAHNPQVTAPVAAPVVAAPVAPAPKPEPVAAPSEELIDEDVEDPEKPF